MRRGRLKVCCPNDSGDSGCRESRHFAKARRAGRQTSAQPGPCFPVVLVGALHSMRFSVKKTALATLSTAAKGGSKGKGWGRFAKNEHSPGKGRLNSAWGALIGKDLSCLTGEKPSVVPVGTEFLSDQCYPGLTRPGLLSCCPFGTAACFSRGQGWCAPTTW